ncbi:hypothetical protein JRO89_XS03G0128800 [Xanthoceras sorbifolium]|uniref:Uncharacterized protein n=1 Tax=Xanthoceras sorbifolium TaxID=99658 RepID=A0ABQ8IAA9_9ROSI|nr:hypothetical protein JRO89_XS03G0128800 [Xanthoceras sorbifolium]
MPNPEVNENSGSDLESQVHVSSSAEEPATLFSDDKNDVACTLYPIKPETSSSESQENMVINASAGVAEGSMAYVGQKADAQGNGKVKSDRVIDILLPNEYADQPSETESKSQEMQEMTSHPLSADGVVLSKEDHGDATAAKMSSVLSTRSRVTVEREKEMTMCMSFLCLADIPVVDHAEIKLKGFKDHKGVKLNNSIGADSLEIIKDKDDDVEYPVSEENYTSFQPVQLSELPKASASDLHVSEDIILPEGSMHTVEKQSTEGESDVPQIKLTCNEKSDDLGTPVASVTIATEESLPVCSVGKQPPSYVCDDLLHKDFLETALNVLNDVDPMIAPEDVNAIGPNDAGNYKKAISETNDVAGNDENKSVEEENNAKNRTTVSKSATYRPEILANLTTNLHKSDDAGDHEKGKIETSAVVGVERGEVPVDEKLLLKTKPASEYATSLQKLEVVADDVMDMTAMKLPETKFRNLDTVSGTQDGAEQLEISGIDKAQEKRVAKHDIGAELSEDHATKVTPVSTFGTEASKQSFDAVDDNHTGEFGRGDTITNLSLQGESIGNHFVKHQLGASPVDVSVDSFSQTDSLEGNWGSISVLSTQSDAPVVDAETLPSTDYLASAETNKSHMKAEAATEGQHSSKSDIFEAPSFMTLVEPGGGANHKAAAPETQTIQNLQQQNAAASSQAGWFPSLTHVVNESEGRKKNEEIIAKVTNWSTGKQHTPLKNLLGEAKHEARPKSPNPKENQAHVIRKDETVSKDNGAAVVTTVSSILGPEDTKRETGKEGNSPARYPTDIKREKRKVKGRPYWVQFMCCSSVNYARLVEKMLNQDVGKLALCSNFVLIVWRWLQFADAAAINHVPHLDTWEVSEQIRNGIVLPWKHKKLSSTGEKKYINCGK